MDEGLYESLLTADLRTRLELVSKLTAAELAVDAADEPHVVARHVAEVVRRHLAYMRP